MNNGNRPSWIDLLSIAGLAAAIYVIYLLFLKADWRSVTAIDPLPLLAGLGIGVVSLLLAGVVLSSIIAATGFSVRSRIKRSIFAANRTILTKYIPGKIWYVIGISESLARDGMTRTHAWSVVILYQAILITTALLLGLSGSTMLELGDHELASMLEKYGSWEILGLMAVATLITICILYGCRKKVVASVRNVEVGWLFLAAFISIVHWILQGVAVWMVLSAVHGTWLDALTILIVPAVYAVGFLVLVAPGGMGVRELLFLQYFIHLGLATDTAAGLAIMARIASLGMEMGAWGLIYIMGYRGEVSRREESSRPS